jgi:hypothetical protein
MARKLHIGAQCNLETMTVGNSGSSCATNRRRAGNFCRRRE